MKKEIIISQEKQQHLERIKLLMKNLNNKKEKRYLTEFFKLPQLKCKFPRERAFDYKRNSFINKKVLRKIEILESSFNYSIANQLGHQLDNVAEHDEKNSTFQRLKENNVNDKIEVEVTLSLRDNISSFNFAQFISI